MSDFSPMEYQKSLLAHAMGLSGTKLESHRNYFAASPNSHDQKQWEILCENDLAENRGSRPIFGDLICYVVTAKGEPAARNWACSQKPPEVKMTRSQKRYAAYLHDETTESFFEWMKRKEYNRKAVGMNY